MPTRKDVGMAPKQKGGIMILDLLQNRRSVRKFQTEALEPQQIESLKEAVLRSPSSRGLNPWEFIFVDDKRLLKKLSGAKLHGAEFVQDAALAIVICADPAVCDVWIEDCAIASFVTHLTAHSIGLGSCWVQIRLRTRAGGQDSEAYVREALGIPETLRVLSIVAIGKPAQKLRPAAREKLDWNKIHANHW
jgi:nitroreductase